MRRGRLLGWAVVAGLALLAALRTEKLAGRYTQFVAFWNDPARLPALPEDSRIRFQPAAESCAREVAAILPAAMAQVERRQARPFARGPIVGVYASFEDYARANGLGDAGVAATARDGRVMLSPTLCGEERARLARVLTHELSHTHLFGWRAASTAAPPPSWFTEGLAVMVSDGGAAEQTSEAEASRALAQGFAIVVADTGSWPNFAAITFEKEPPAAGSAQETLALRQGLAFREAAMFVAWLQSSDAAGFANLLHALEDGGFFGAAFVKAYGADAAAKWREFRGTIGVR